MCQFDRISGPAKQVRRSIMAELSMERHLAVSHSELTSGHDVTQLLSQINENFKQSKADQILRLLQDQDKLTDKLTETIVDDRELIQEYERIREEKVLCDSDTLTDSSSESGETVNTINAVETVTDNMHSTYNKVTNIPENSTNVQSREIMGYRRHRARTSVGFHNDMPNSEENNKTLKTSNNFDTRDLNLRPKSSYVRRHQYVKRDDVDSGGGHVAVEDFTESQHQRPSRSARPKSRYGRASISRSERTIAMIDAETVIEPDVPTKEEIIRGEANNIMYDRFASTRQPKRESKRNKAFCDSNFVVPQQQTIENVSVDSIGNVMDTREEITEVQTIGNVYKVRSPHVSSFTPNSVPRNSPVQTHVLKRQSIAHVKQEHVANHSHYQHPSVMSSLLRSDTTSNATMRSERPDNISPASQIPLKRNNSNLAFGRPKNPEPVMSRPIERPDIRQSMRNRRLHRRFMAPTQSHMAQVRPTSESVILARQKTEKNLMKRQAENRPHSEKIPTNTQNKNIDLNLNPTQGQQTYVTSKGGVTQASHVQGGGFRGYDPGNRLQSSTQSRDLHGDLTLPRRGQNNMILGGRQPLAALMKLPALEATLAAKEKERGLALAARETCV